MTYTCKRGVGGVLPPGLCPGVQKKESGKMRWIRENEQRSEKGENEEENRKIVQKRENLVEKGKDGAKKGDNPYPYPIF